MITDFDDFCTWMFVLIDDKATLFNIPTTERGKS